MPIEFAAAAYRFGHSMVRPSYRANFSSSTGDGTDPTANPFFALVFDPNEPAFSDPVSHDRADLLGGYPAPRRYIGWQTFFDLGDGQVKNNKKIDPTISSVLFTLPLPAIAPHTQTSPTVLPQRNLLRQLTWGLPSGQAIARAMRVPGLGPSDLSDIGGVYRPFATSTPLWYYILAEAKALAGGLNLGPVGARIVTETLIGLLPRRPHQLPQRPPALSSVPRHRPQTRTHPQPQHHRQPNLHPRPLPPLRRRHQPRHLPMITQLLTAAHLASIMVVLRLVFGARRMAPRPATSDA